jgi:hypothetical protein
MFNDKIKKKSIKKIKKNIRANKVNQLNSQLGFES